MDAQGWYLRALGVAASHIKTEQPPTVDRGPRKSHCESSLLFENFAHSHPQVLILGCFYVTHTVFWERQCPQVGKGPDSGSATNMAALHLAVTSGSSRVVRGRRPLA